MNHFTPSQPQQCAHRLEDLCLVLSALIWVQEFCWSIPANPFLHKGPGYSLGSDVRQSKPRDPLSEVIWDYHYVSITQVRCVDGAHKI